MVPLESFDFSGCPASSVFAGEEPSGFAWVAASGNPFSVTSGLAPVTI